jgi:hypothetical protein
VVGREEGRGRKGEGGRSRVEEEGLCFRIFK